MTKTELMKNYTVEQLADIVIELEGELKTVRNLENEVLFEERIVNNIRNATGMNIDDVRKAVQDTKKYMNDTYTEESKNQIEHMKSEVEKYRKAFEDAKKERDCQIVEYRNRAEKDKTELERAKKTINQIDDILERLFGVRHDTVDKPDEFEKILSERAKGNVRDFLPTEPIKVADILMNAEVEYERNPLEKAFCGTDKGTYRIFEVSELRQIAEHLLVYCNHNGEAEE